jgi:hypothetical protein
MAPQLRVGRSVEPDDRAVARVCCSRRGTAPLLPIRGAGGERALFEPRGGRILALGLDDLLVATAAGGDSVVVTTPCRGRGGLVRRWLDGRVAELHPRPAPAACAGNDDTITGDVPVSAAFSADGRFLVYAVPAGTGWRAQVVDPSGRTRTLRESAHPLVVLGWP